MAQLQKLVEDYVGSLGFRLLDRREGFVIADHLGYAGERSTWLVWIPKPPSLPQDFPSLERSLRGELNKLLPRYPRGRSLVVMPTLEGFSTAFRREAGRLGVELTVPIRFFDSPFKS